MLGKMLIHGLLAAALIGSAAAVYAQSADNGYLKPDAVAPQASAGKDAKTAAGGERAEGVTAKPQQRDGWLSAEHGRKKSDHHGDRRHHDDEDDD